MRSNTGPCGTRRRARSRCTWSAAAIKRRALVAARSYSLRGRSYTRKAPTSIDLRCLRLSLSGVDGASRPHGRATDRRLGCSCSTPNYAQHSAHIEPGRDGLFNLIKSMPPTFKHEHEQIVADGELVIVHSRFSGFGQAKNWVVADFVRVVDGILVEHWDVVEDEASQADSKSGRPMFGDRFPV